MKIPVRIQMTEEQIKALDVLEMKNVSAAVHFFVAELLHEAKKIPDLQEKTNYRTVSLPKELYDEVKRVAEMKGVSASTIIKKCVQLGIDRTFPDQRLNKPIEISKRTQTPPKKEKSHGRKSVRHSGTNKGD